MVAITYRTVGRDIKRRVIVEYKSLKPGSPTRYGAIVTQNGEYEPVQQLVTTLSKGSQIFHVVESVGSSGGKIIHHFRYLGDLMDFLRREYIYERGFFMANSRKKSDELGLALTRLKNGEYKRLIVDRYLNFEVKDQ